MSTKTQDATERLAAKWYPAKWSLDALKVLVEQGKLTEDAYERVTGEEYE